MAVARHRGQVLSEIPVHVPPAAKPEPSKATQFVVAGYRVMPGADGSFIVAMITPPELMSGSAGFTNAADMLKWLKAGHDEYEKGRADGWF